MNRYSCCLLAMLLLPNTLTPAQDVYNLGGLQIPNHNVVTPMPMANQPQLIPVSKSAEVLRRLFEGKSQEAAQFAANHLQSLVPAYLEFDPQKQLPFQRETTFVQFIHAYNLGPEILESLAADTDPLDRAAITEMVGEEDLALSAYQSAEDDPRMRKRYAFLLAKHGSIAEAKRVLAGIAPDSFPSVIQSLQNAITSQSLFVGRLDYFDLLITALENADPATYLAAEWLPNLIDNYFAEGHYSSDDRDVRLVELYANGDYRTGYNTPEQEARSQIAEERRLIQHEALCRALMRLPQFADDGFRRFAGMASKHGAETSLQDLAMTIIKMSPAPQPPESNPHNTPTRHFRSHWVPFYSPVEYLLRHAMENSDVDALTATLTPILKATGEETEIQFLADIKKLLAAPPEDFSQQAAALMRVEHSSISPDNLMRMLFELMKSRDIDDRGPVIEAYMGRLAHSSYPSLDDIVSYASEQRKLGLDNFRAFLKKIGTIMLGPVDQQAAFIAEHYRPNHYEPNSPGNRINNYVNFLTHMGQNLNLAAPVLAEAFELSLVHPNSYQLSNAVQNSLQSYRYRGEVTTLYQFLKDSPFLRPLKDFRTYPMSNVQRESVFGHLLESLRQISSNDRARVLQPIRDHKPDSFGKQAILAFVDGGSSSSARSTALATQVENHIDAIGKLPAERQQELYDWFRNMNSNRSSLPSSIRNAAPKTTTWYEAMKKQSADSPNQSRSRRNDNALPSIEQFLTASERSDVEVSYPLQHIAVQLAQSVFSTDLAQAEAVIGKYLVLANQAPTPQFSNGQETRPLMLDNVLAQLLAGSPGTENLGFVIKMIHQAKDPNDGIYPILQSSMQAALTNESFEPVTPLANDMATTFLAASGNQVHELLVPLFLTRFQTLDAETLHSIIQWAAEHPNNVLAPMLNDCANLALAAGGDVTRRAPAESVFVQRLRDGDRSLALRVRVCPVAFPMALQAQAWPIADACLATLADAFTTEDFRIPPNITEQMMVVPLKQAPSGDEKRILNELLTLWTQHGEKLPMSIAALQRATTLAARADYPGINLLAKLPEHLQRQPGFLISMLRIDALEAALQAVPWTLVTMPPMVQNNRGNSRGRGIHPSGGKRSTLNLSGGTYDTALHSKSAVLLSKIPDQGQRLFVELMMAALEDDADLADSAPKRDARLQALVGRYDRSHFNTPYLAEHTLSWLCAATSSTPEVLRKDITHFGRQLKYQPLSDWRDGVLRASRMNLWDHFMKDAAANAPEQFAEVLTDMLEEIGPDRGQSQQLLDNYVGEFPKDVLQDVESITPEKAAQYLPLLKTLCEMSRRTYWRGRDECINGNVVMHVLANQTEGYSGWLSGLDPNTRSYLEGNVNLDQIVYMIRKGLSADEVSKERRSQILNGLFAITSNANQSRSSRSQDTNVFERMIDLDVLKAEDILESGPQWAEANPRGGAAYGELAKYQAAAGQVDEAIVNYTQAVVHAPPDNQRLYTQYHMANAALLLEQGRLDAAMTWFEFAHPGRIDPNMQDEHHMLKRKVDIRYLTDPSRLKAVFADCSRRLVANPRDVAAWTQLAKTLNAHGGERMASSDYIRGLAVLKLTYYLLTKINAVAPQAVNQLLPSTAQDLSRGLVALGMGGRKKYFVNRGESWSYQYPENGLHISNWNTMAYAGSNDWEKARAPIGYGNGNERTTISFGDDEDNKPITAYFSKLVNIEGLSESDSLSMSVLHDDGVIVYINGREVARNNMPAGRAEPDTQAPSSRGGSDEMEYWTTSISAEALSDGIHVIAAEVHQNDPDSSDLSFDLDLYTEAFNSSTIIEEIETGKPMKHLGQWRAHLPEDLVDMAKALSQ